MLEIFYLNSLKFFFNDNAIKIKLFQKMAKGLFEKCCY